MQTPMEEEAVLASSNGSSSVSESAAAASDMKLPATLPEISAVTVSTTAIAATVQT